MTTKKELEIEKDFIILKASNYHYDLGIQYEKERIKKLINKSKVIETRQDLEQEGVEYILIDREELKGRINENEPRD